MNSIRPIETEYRGYLFRSRLEARWAVFFDTLGVPYEYEPEGYDLGDGILYLPDFWLPTWESWVEVKPRMSSPETERAVELLARLGEGTGWRTLLFSGEVWPGRTLILDVNPRGGVIDYGRIAQCRKCDGLCLLATDGDMYHYAHDNYGWCEIGPHTCGDNEKWPLDNTPRIIGAYTAARRARFEFGAQPHRR